jgi:CDP-2,3-bis-(O-geranylgeranyl)-sn-glycerol synthase
MILGGGSPLDLKKTWRGRRLLGDGKTWRGSITGTLTGLGAAELLNLVSDSILLQSMHLTYFSLETAFVLSAGAIMGDIVFSFFKRFSGIEQGENLFLIDQLDFLIGGLFGILIFKPLLASEVMNFHSLIYLSIITVAIHVSSNLVAFRLGMQETRL